MEKRWSSHIRLRRSESPPAPPVYLSRYLSLSPPEKEVVIVSRCGGHWGLQLGGDGEAGGHRACGEEAAEKLVVGAEWWSWGLQRGGDGEVGGREKRWWSWGLRRETEKLVRRLAQED
ncbi:hypothetical protein F2Q68_00004313 [Brassica cretica]|uniref:Uncharacterized protein n=1 Tax=Brassica cretica TaxID=69181 RepID=A0A8S9JPA5_BRACR|nr:hypothetical protein F2Q68_00004313 [Brassica cretica]